MAKNKRRAEMNAHQPMEVRQPWAGIPLKGWKVIGAGIGTVIVGFIVLSFTDPGGQNWASSLSPFLILGGYGAIAAGIIQK